MDSTKRNTRCHNVLARFVDKGFFNNIKGVFANRQGFLNNKIGVGAFIMCFVAIVTLTVVTACSVSYKLNGASIDYTKTKTIQLADFPIRSAYVWGPMASIFNNNLKDKYAANTRLIQVKRNGDLKIEGEITQYNQRNKSVNAENYSSQTELSMTVNVRFTNNKNHDEDFEKTFTSTRIFPSNQNLMSVQEELVTQMCKDLCDQIFNSTVANW